jgi:hypothetical protein
LLRIFSSMVWKATPCVPPRHPTAARITPPAAFGSLVDLRSAVDGFVAGANTTPKPFARRAGPDDIVSVLRPEITC